MDRAAAVTLPGPELKSAHVVGEGWRNANALSAIAPKDEQERRRLKLAVSHSLLLGIKPSTALQLQDKLIERENQDKRFYIYRKSLWDGIKQAYNEGSVSIDMATIASAALYGDVDEKELKKLLAQEKKRLPKPEERYVPGGLGSEALIDATQFAPSQIASLKAGGIGAAGGATLFGLVGMLGGPEVGLPAAAFGARLGGAVGAGKASFDLEGGSIVMEMLDRGVPLSIAADMGRIGGSINALIETGQAFTLMKTIPGVGEVGEEAVKKTINSAIKSTLKSYGKFVAEETGQEVAQEAVSAFVEELGVAMANKFEGLGIPHATARSIADRIIQTARASALGFTVMGLPSHTAHLIKARRAALSQAETGGVVEDQLKPAHGEQKGQPQADMAGQQDQGQAKAGATAEEVAAKIDLPVEDKELDRIILETPEDQIDSEVDKLITRLDQTKQQETSPLLDNFRAQVGEILQDDEQADTVTALLSARAKAAGMTPDEYIEQKGLSVERASGKDIAEAKRQTGRFNVVKGAVEFAEDGRTIIKAFEAADVSTMVHELGHVFRRDLAGDDLAVVERWAGVEGGKWTMDSEEKFAGAFERYLKDGKAPVPELQSVFERFKQWLAEVYRVVRGRLPEVPDEIRGVMDRLLGDQGQKQLVNDESTLFQSMADEFGVSEEQIRKEFEETRAKYESTNQWLKAPNGEDTNLNEHLWVMVRTPRFKEWFGDWENDPDNASKVVDENGEPLVVYHGTDQDIEKFDTEKLGVNTGAKSAREGFFFTNNARAAGLYPVYPVEMYLRLGGFYPGFSIPQGLIGKERAKAFNDALANARKKAEKNNIVARYSRAKKDFHKLIEDLEDEVLDNLSEKDADAVMAYLGEEIPALQEVWKIPGGKRKDLVDHGKDIFDHVEEKFKNIFNLAEKITILRREVDDFEYIKRWSDKNLSGSSLDDAWGGKETELSLQPNIIPSFLLLKNPLIYDQRTEYRDKNYTSVLKEAKKNGNDGVIIRDTKDPLPMDVFVAISPTQIKSIYNRGSFDQQDARILYQADQADREAEQLALYRHMLEQAAQAAGEPKEYHDAMAEAERLAEERTGEVLAKEEKRFLAEARKEAARIVRAEPVYKAMSEAVRIGGLSLDQISVDYDKGTIRDLLRKRPGLFTKKSTVSPDEFAADHGFESLDAMIEAFLDAKPIKEAVADRAKIEENHAVDLFEEFSKEERDRIYNTQLSKALDEVFSKRRPKVSAEIKKAIERIHGIRQKEEPTVTEREALRAAFRKAAQAARKAMSEGKKEGVAKERERLKAMFAKRVAKQQSRAEARKLRDRIVTELRSTRVKRQAGKPAGRYTADVQHILDKLRDVLRLSRDEAANNLRENLFEWQEKNEHPPFNVAIENRLLELRIRFKDMQPDELRSLLKDIQAVKETGRMLRLVEDLDRKEKWNRYRAEAVQTISGGQGLPPGVKALGTSPFRPRTTMAAFKRFAHTIGKSFVGWNDILDILSKHDKQSRAEESALMVHTVLKETNLEKRGQREMAQRLNEMVKQAYGLKTNREIRRKLQRDVVDVENIGEFVNLFGHREKLEFTRAELRKRAMELMDPSLAGTFVTMGYTEEMRAAIFNKLTPEDRNFINAQLKFYQDYHESINAVYRRLYGVDLPKNPFYSPIKRSNVATPVDDNLGEFLREIPFRAAATSGSLKSRVGSTLPLENQADTTVLVRHVGEMEHFKAWADKIRDLNAVFKNGEVRAAIEHFHGRDILAIIDGFIGDMARGGIEAGRRLTAVDKAIARFTRSVLAIQPDIMIKQLVSFPAYAETIPFKAFLAGLTDFWKSPVENTKTLYTSDMMQSRGQNMDRDIKAAIQSRHYNRFMAGRNFRDLLMLNVMLGDQGAIVAGGWSVYRYWRNQGLSHREALAKFEEATRRTQQSGDIDQLSYWQRGGSFAKLFTMFLSSPNQYIRREIMAIRNLMAGRMSIGQAAKTLFIYHILLPSMFQLIIDRLTWDWDEQKLAMLLGPLNGLFLVGQGLDFIIRKALGVRAFDMDVPIMSIFDDEVKAIGLVTDDNLTDEDVLRGVRGLAGAGGKLTGYPLQQSLDMLKGAHDILEGEYEKGITEMLGWSPYQAEKLAND